MLWISIMYMGKSHTASNICLGELRESYMRSHWIRAIYGVDQMPVILSTQKLRIAISAALFIKRYCRIGRGTLYR